MNPLEHHDGVIYTLVDDNLVTYIEKLIRSNDGAKNLSEIANVDAREISDVVHRKRKAVSDIFLDNILTGTGLYRTLNDFEWYTPKQLVEKGVWKHIPPVVKTL